ncbi:MAG: DNA alkylation repair protein [Clostridiales bacterium]|nr:DNA alkylation repair protein [Clostridiales bacterium]
MNRIEQEIREHLFALQDAQYKEFHSRLMPTVDPDTIIGVRTPALRRYAAELAKLAAVEAFLKAVPHRYYEENNLHGMLIERMRDYRQTVHELNAFLPYVDNWATCDLMSPKAFVKNKSLLIEDIRRWIASDRVYTVRFAVGMLLKHYLDEDFLPEYLEMAASVPAQEYYVSMMVAWYFATALVKQYDAALSYLLQNRLDEQTHNRTIRKAIESYRISQEQKQELKKLIRR